MQADADTFPRRTVLSIAGSDPTGGAGLQLDLQVFALHRVHGMAVPTALTVQTTRGVEQVLPAFPNVVEGQLRGLLRDLEPAAIKIGMLATDDIVLCVGRVLENHPAPRVVDPVLAASDGTLLLERRAHPTLVSCVIAGAALVTPNLSEAEALTGEADPERAAAVLLKAGAQAVLIKGGHADAEPDDLLVTAETSTWLRGKRSGVGAVHGTGCALSAAIAARLARGEALAEAARAAKAFVEAAIEQSFVAGAGQRLLGLPDPACISGSGSRTT
ncbi:MAG: bifunctional hydroxymethylpyrimidine kinase/phosphomethylpyrimidine kinase [Myxococcales bacterium]|nr:bifunctional hydroxymethylpyrimidine kinase/phosphomethylpyrimidine kinase [Myxococcales bacterium]